MTQNTDKPSLAQKALIMAGVGAVTGALVFGSKKFLKKEVPFTLHKPPTEALHNPPKETLFHSLMRASRRNQLERTYAAAKANHDRLSRRLVDQPNHSKLKKAVADAKSYMETLHTQLTNEV